MENIRIPLNINKSQNIVFKLDQDFENLEVLSLKLSTYDVYSQMTSDFGVIVGRVNVNGGFGVQNAKVSVFVPLDAADTLRPEILQLYPFKGVTDKLSNGVRYNIFPRTQQSNISHQAIGIFPDVVDLTYYPTYLEVYEKYYKFTTTTNNSGDYMIFGAPLGAQYLHMDFDLFDTKSFYITADDIVTEVKTSATISAQLSQELTEAINPNFVLNADGAYEVKLKTDLDAMPNVFSENKLVNVVPFWGDKTLHEIGISQCNFEINYEYVPTAVLFGSLINVAQQKDIGFNYRANNNAPIQNQSPAKDLKVIVYKHIGEYLVERYGVYSAIPTTGDSTNGVFIVNLPMYEDYYVTNEFGQLVATSPNSDGTPSKLGIPTKGHYVFEFFDDNESAYGGNGRRRLEGDNNINPRNYWSTLTAGIRVPANKNGHADLCGWATNHLEWNQTLFEYDIFTGKQRFYTIETKFNKHSDQDIRLEGSFVTYLPTIDRTLNYNIPIKKEDSVYDAILRGSLFSPLFLVQNVEYDSALTDLNYAQEITWVPFFNNEQTSNYDVKAWDWLFGVGVKFLKGKTKGGLFNELYGTGSTHTLSGYTSVDTWYFGDNPKNSEENLAANFYAQTLATKPEAASRNINSIHNRFNLAVTAEYTAGLFVSSIENKNSKVLFETSIIDITDVLPRLISNGIYSSYDGETNMYENHRYLFGVQPTTQNALYEIKKRYFNG